MTSEGPEAQSRVQVDVAGQKLTQGELIEQLAARVHRLEQEMERVALRVAELELTHAAARDRRDTGPG